MLKYHRNQTSSALNDQIWNNLNNKMNYAVLNSNPKYKIFI